jgi:hypothetical protein
MAIMPLMSEASRGVRVFQPKRVPALGLSIAYDFIGEVRKSVCL